MRRWLISLIVLAGMSGAAVASATAGPSTARLAINVGPDGKFNLGVPPSGGSGAQADGWDLLFRWPGEPWSSYTTLRIDGTNSTYGEVGTRLRAPADTDAVTNQSAWRISDIRVDQTLEIVPNPQTGQLDLAKIVYIVRNEGSVAHEVGLRVMLDTEINYDDGAPFRLPGRGILMKEDEFLGEGIPNSFDVYAVTDPIHAATAIVRGLAATPPDRLVLARWTRIFFESEKYNYAIDRSLTFADDSAYALYWTPTPLDPGASRMYVTYYGRGDVGAATLGPVSVGATGPATLQVVANQYSPNPFDIVGTVANQGTAPLTNLQLVLSLPPELSVLTVSGAAALGTTACEVRAPVGELPGNRERQVTWRVQAAPQSTAKTLSYSITATAAGEQPVTVQRQVTLPALTAAAVRALQSDFRVFLPLVTRGHFPGC